MKKELCRTKFYKYIAVVLLALCLTCASSGCGSSGDDETTRAAVVQSGEVDSPEDFTRLGMYINIDTSNSNVTDVKYEISGEIAIVSFRYSGVRVEFRASCKYEKYELAGIENTSNGDMIISNIEGLNATYYTLDPGRIAFWSDGTINYSLYIYVTATDEVLNEIIDIIEFENRYGERSDVQEQTDSDSKVFAERIVQVFNDKSLEDMVDMVYYPQELGSGQSVANSNELLELNKDDLFTDILLDALNDESAMDELRLSADGSEYIIGTNYKNVHFKKMDDGSFKITEINN